MASHLILDRADAGVNELVTGWTDGSTYEVRLRIKQSNTDAKTARFEVEEVTDETSGEEASASEGEGVYAKPAKPAPGKPAVTIQK